MRRYFLVLSIILPLCSVYGQELEFLPRSPGEQQVVRHSNYTLSYSESHEQAEWVYYFLDSNKLSGRVKRKDAFRSDELILTGSATLSDYKGSGYDRGHLCPAADNSFSASCMSESFYMSNMSPQHPSFNRGKWKQLEELFREWTEKSGGLYIVTAGILSDSLPTIGSNGVSIPAYFYKIAYDAKASEMIGFLMPNRKIDEELFSFIVAVDQIEKMTGIDFFPQLEDELEEKLEREVDTTFWFIAK